MLKLLVRERPPIKERQLARCGDGIPYLPSIHVLGRQVVDAVLEPGVVDVGLAEVAEAREEVAPDLAALRRRQVLVVQRQLDARLEGLVEDADAVGGEYEDA